MMEYGKLITIYSLFYMLGPPLVVKSSKYFKIQLTIETFNSLIMGQDSESNI